MSNLYVHPKPGALGKLISRLANSKRLAWLRRNTIGRLPFTVLVSDVTNVIYATWLVDAKAASQFVPPGMTLWQRDGLTPFTILTYAHGHFGPRRLGCLRRFFPSPLQSNWRLYLEEATNAGPDQATVVFVKNVLSSAAYALGTRLFSDALPSHLASEFSLNVGSDSASIMIEPGVGSAPSLRAQFEILDHRQLPLGFKPFCASWSEAVNSLTKQDAAVTPVAGIHQVAHATIHLPVDVERVVPLQLKPETLACPFLDVLGIRSEAFCFLLPSVRFEALSERLIE